MSDAQVSGVFFLLRFVQKQLFSICWDAFGTAGLYGISPVFEVNHRMQIKETPL